MVAAYDSGTTRANEMLTVLDAILPLFLKQIVQDKKTEVWAKLAKSKMKVLFRVQESFYCLRCGFAGETLLPHWVDKQLPGKNFCFLPSFQVGDSKQGKNWCFLKSFRLNNERRKWSNCAYAAKNDRFWTSEILKESKNI